MTPVDPIEFARAGDASEIARMSRDLIEAGLPWTWRPERVAQAIRASEVNVVVARARSIDVARARRDHPARARGAIAGFCIMEFGYSHAHLCLLGVRAGYRRRGLGAALTRWQETVAVTAGLTSVNLELRAGNAQAMNFYRRLGFEQVGTKTGYYSSMEDAVVMRHELKQAAGSATGG